MNAKSICTLSKTLGRFLDTNCKEESLKYIEIPCFINHKKVPFMIDQRPASLARQLLWCMDPSKPWILQKDSPATVSST